MRDYYGGGIKEKSDEEVITQLMNGRQLQQDFLLREELKEGIKKVTRKINSLKKKMEKAKKREEERVFKNVSVQCEDLMIEDLDLEESLDKVIEYEQERNRIESGYQVKIDKLGFELQASKLKLLDCKRVLEKKSDQAEMIMRTQNQYKLLGEDYKTTCKMVRDRKERNKELERKYQLLDNTVDGKNKEVIDKVKEIELKIEVYLGRNRDLVDKIDLVNKKYETSEEMKQKGTSANIELKKLHKWNEKKDERIQSLQEERENLEGAKQGKNSLIKSYEEQLANIEERHARKLREVIKSKEKIINNVYARSEVLQGYKEVSKSIRETEIRCLNKIEYQKAKHEILLKRIKALSYLERGVASPDKEINEKMQDVRSLYKNKIRKFREENDELEIEMKRLRRQIAEKKLGRSLDMSESESLALSDSFIYSDINSMIESISIQGGEY